MCSGVFVAGRSLADVLADLEREDLSVLGYLRTVVDARSETVTVSAAGRLPAGTFHAAGHEGQLVTVVPSRDVVITRLGRTRQTGVWDHCAFVTAVLGALETS